jgi:NTE family protein
MPGPIDLVLSGGGVLGVAHVGAVAVLEEHGYEPQRIAGTSAGSIVGALLAAGASAGELHGLFGTLELDRALDPDALDRVPLLGPALSVVLENGYAKGDYLRNLVAGELDKRGVSTFADLRREGAGDDPRPEQRWRLTVLAADVTRGELLRLPQDYARYGLDPDAQTVADAVRASISVPYLFEPARLRHHEGESLLVDGGIISNYPLDVFDRTDGRAPRWQTIGVTLLPQLPAQDVRLIPQLRLLHPVPGFRFLESVLSTALVGRDQGYLDQPGVRARSINVDSLGIDPFDFSLSPLMVQRLYESGRRAAEVFLARSRERESH